MKILIKQSLSLFCLLCISSFLWVKGQNKVTDSLEKILPHATDKKEKLILLNQLTKEYASFSLDKSLQYGNQALEIAHKLKDEKKEAEVLLNIGEAYSLQDKFNEAIESYQKALVLCQKGGYHEEVALSSNGIGLNYYLQGKYNDALKYYLQALDISRKFAVKKEEGNALFNMGQVYKKKNDNTKAGIYYNQALKVFESIKDINGLAKINNSFGVIQSEKGNYNNAINYYEKALKYRQMENDKRGSAILYLNLGNVLLKWGKYEQAIIDYQQALKIFEEIGLPDGIATCSDNIGNVYEYLTRENQFIQNINYYNKALEFHQKALKIWETLGNEYEIAQTLSNIGNVYAKQTYEKLSVKYGANWENSLENKDKDLIAKEYAQAIDYYRKSLSLREKIGDKRGKATSLYNLGKIYNYSGNYNQALTYLEKALKLDEELDDKYEISIALYQIGSIYYNLGNYEKSLEYLNRSLTIAQKNELSEVAKYIFLMQSNVYLSSGEYLKSLSAYKKFGAIQDSLLAENNMKQINELQTKYDTEKKDQENNLLKKDVQLKKVQFKQTVYLFTAGMVSVLIIILLLFRQNREREKTNIELEAKNELITEQKKEITDSIQYASRIQKAVMYVESQLRQYLPDSFIYFKPRDIVSGDFYWVSEKNGKIVVATADCTGHGVPGAFMSMLGMSMLNNIIAEMEEARADEMLNELRLRIIESLHQTGRSGENKDGIDLALYILDSSKTSLEYAGANNPLFIIRKDELLETKADRMPIGIYEKAMTPFTKHIIPLQKEDMIYTFSDGYHDQFGGPDNKKFMSGNLKKLLIKISSDSINNQYKFLDQTITEWMKDTYQIDDILVMGVRI
jgi:tetratricopeptide (TPR) repeat protein